MICRACSVQMKDLGHCKAALPALWVHENLQRLSFGVDLTIAFQQPGIPDRYNRFGSDEAT
jgi:hypothetical protein